ncbi:Golgi apparatus protein 1, partial [Eurytemora carolleeae]|uniref:Golgi apparatus protein 1 n=1 Tax=Eurytemora carolleeae TaxID=1294199 RepID=UPI000C776C81
MNHFIFLPLVYFMGTANCDITDDLLADSVECRQDFLAIKDHCKFSDHLKGNEGNNWLVLECLQNPPGQTKLSEQCDHYLWRFKLQITQGGFIEHAEKTCKEEINQLRLCEQDRNSAPGHFLSCLVENKHNTKNIGCRKFLERVETLIFGDFRLVSNFMNACQADVDKLNCGRTGKSENDPHSQGRTIACLEEKVTEVGDECKQQILQIAEMQAESVTLDRALVMACKEDMSRFCSSLLEVPSSDQIYDCLMVNKMNDEMSTECRKEVSRRQKLVNVDYKVSNTLIKACKVDIKENRCRKDLDKNMNVGLNQILVCLEDARLQGSTISGSCSREMSEYRRALMEDFSVSPELVKDCFYDVSQYCPNAGKSGKTIHCLMQLSMDKDPDKLLSPKCDKTLMEFLRDTEVCLYCTVPH